MKELEKVSILNYPMENTKKKKKKKKKKKIYIYI